MDLSQAIMDGAALIADARIQHSTGHPLAPMWQPPETPAKLITNRRLPQSISISL